MSGPPIRNSSGPIQRSINSRSNTDRIDINSWLTDQKSGIGPLTGFVNFEPESRIMDHESDENLGSLIRTGTVIWSGLIIHALNLVPETFSISLSFTNQGQTIRWRSFKESLIYLFVLWSPGFALVFLSSYLALFLCRFGAKFNEQTKQRLITTV